MIPVYAARAGFVYAEVPARHTRLGITVSTLF